MSKVVEVTEQNFEYEVLKSGIPTVLDFWAPWCGPCQRLAPVYDKLSSEYEGRFKFCKMNIDENKKTAMQYKIMSIPTQIIFRDGHKVEEIHGAIPEQTIRKLIEGILQGKSSNQKLIV